MSQTINRTHINELTIRFVYAQLSRILYSCMYAYLFTHSFSHSFFNCLFLSLFLSYCLFLSLTLSYSLFRSLILLLTPILHLKTPNALTIGVNTLAKILWCYITLQRFIDKLSLIINWFRTIRKFYNTLQFYSNLF